MAAAALAAIRAVAARAAVAERLEAPAGEAILRSVVDAAAVLIRAEAASIALFDPDSGRLVFRVAAGEHGQGVIGLAVQPGEGVERPGQKGGAQWLFAGLHNARQCFRKVPAHWLRRFRELVHHRFHGLSQPPGRGLDLLRAVRAGADGFGQAACHGIHCLRARFRRC